MSANIDHLRELYSRLGGEETFVEHQREPVGRLHDDAEIDADIREIVTAMRERYAVRTSLSDDDLVRVVRGYFAGLTDAEIADAVGATSSGVVARARVNLHCFRPEDTDAPFDVGDLRRLLAEGHTDAECAAALDASEHAVAWYRHVLDRLHEARVANDQFRADFESVLSNADLAEALTAGSIADLRMMEEVTD